MDDCDGLGCLATLAGTIFACAAAETGVTIGACVAGAVGAGNTCFPCICWALDSLLGPADWIDEFCAELH